MIELLTIPVEISDITGQKVARVKVPTDATVGEMTSSAVNRLKLPRKRGGQPVTYYPLLERESRHLSASESCGEVLEPADRLVLQPNVDAGGH